MKRIILVSIFCLPLVMILNESGNFMPNIFAILYGYMIYLLVTKTQFGKDFINKLNQ